MRDEKHLTALQIVRNYDKKQIAHRKLKTVHEQLIWVIDQESENVEEIYVLVGPPGSGKSTLMRRLSADILSRYAGEMEDDPGMIPVIFIQLAAPQNGDFNWKDFFARLLEQFNDILIRKKVILRSEARLDGEIVVMIRSLVREELRRAVRNSFQHRKTKFLLLDEAAHLLIIKSGISARVQFEMIKSVAQELHIPIILAGDYSLLNILELNGQLTRRTEVIHFERYNVSELSSPDDLNGISFRNAVHSLLEAMPIEKEANLIDHIDYFFTYSIGIIGLLKKWFKRALWRALRTEEQILTREILDATRWKNKSLQKMLTEAKLGEAQLKDIENSVIASELGLDITPSIYVVTDNFPFANPDTKETVEKPRKGQRRPGTRAPSRDPVGGIPHAT